MGREEEEEEEEGSDGGDLINQLKVCSKWSYKFDKTSTNADTRPHKRKILQCFNNNN